MNCLLNDNVIYIICVAVVFILVSKCPGVLQGLSPKELRSYEEMNSTGRSRKKKKKVKQEVTCL